MKKIGIIICGRYQSCGGGKCFRALNERMGGFSIYSKDEEIQIAGYSYCGGCPGGNIEYVPAEMIKNGVQVIHLATGLVVGYPPCPRIKSFQEFIEMHYNIPVVVGTHPIPMKYFTDHEKLSFWERTGMRKIAPELFKDTEKAMKDYD
ncbi:CGGC domain-containing protein [Acetobacterium bakii]|uniref:Metal-binding-like protein n=1 Tax=Acetobacterium bakii TaxID=52689 RepID=A0A0L6TY13_9FIRM|nr:CGGC domain-containing protein [Acetobacterium bakii]KNZ40962.1 metal-binding-like protein [Acetobacterium bakii]